MKLRFRLSNLLLHVALIAISSAWFLDHRQQKERYDRVNREASILAKQRIHALIHWPPETQRAKNNWWQSQAKLQFDTYEQRRQIDIGLAEAIAGLGGHPARVREGMSVSEARSHLESCGFSITVDEDRADVLHAIKNGPNAKHWVRFEVSNDRVIFVDQGATVM
ncbi:hypothetical protein K227x_49540 [Rubripirellula lacrimiformis]|uniref:PepSY domain-containing protein n=1 Tax=Rubripirellula lacrimiformis TaxID=1930273 RepID=A0A517NHC7_9BACT|nr:hypothetical protein [Rubripirellula lacrimiformis]QDT06544.1 hypothetical protein K227x_49540 [Rubripirellula lacrimiformis]